MTLNPDDLKQKAMEYSKAWSSGSPDAVASHYAPDDQISINRGDPIQGRQAIAEMATGFYAEFVTTYAQQMIMPSSSGRSKATMRRRKTL